MDAENLELHLSYYARLTNNHERTAGAHFFGLPTATSENVVLFPSATGRNLGAGIFVCILTLLGERRVLGIFLLCWTWAGIADAKIIYEHPDGRDLGMHIRAIIIFLVLGPLLLQSSMSSEPTSVLRPQR